MSEEKLDLTVGEPIEESQENLSQLYIKFPDGTMKLVPINGAIDWEIEET